MVVLKHLCAAKWLAKFDSLKEKPQCHALIFISTILQKQDLYSFFIFSFSPFFFGILLRQKKQFRMKSAQHSHG